MAEARVVVERQQRVPGLVRNGFETPPRPSRSTPCSAYRPVLLETRYIQAQRQIRARYYNGGLVDGKWVRVGGRGEGAHRHDCLILLKSLRQFRIVGMRAKLILRLFQSLQRILQTCDFYRRGWKGKEVRGGRGRSFHAQG